MLREASWSRSNSSWGMSQFKRPNATLSANSGFDQRSVIALASSRILELGARCGRVADHSPRIVDPLPCRRGVTPFKAVSADTDRVAKLLREYPPFVTLPSRFSQ